MGVVMTIATSTLLHSPNNTLNSRSDDRRTKKYHSHTHTNKETRFVKQMTKSVEIGNDRAWLGGGLTRGEGFYYEHNGQVNILNKLSD